MISGGKNSQLTIEKPVPESTGSETPRRGHPTPLCARVSAFGTFAESPIRPRRLPDRSDHH